MHGTLLAWWWNQKVRIYLVVVISIAFSKVYLADLPLGRRPRRPSLRARHPLPGRKLQHDRTHFRHSRRRCTQIHARYQPSLHRAHDPRQAKRHRRSMDRYIQRIVYRHHRRTGRRFATSARRQGCVNVQGFASLPRGRNLPVETDRF